MTSKAAPSPAKMDERSAEVDELRAKLRERRDRCPKIKLKPSEEGASIEVASEGAGWTPAMMATGSSEIEFLEGLLKQLGDASALKGQPAPERFDFMLSVVKGIDPRDQTEAMLAAQMAAVHMATMTFARRLASVETIPQQDSAQRALSKLTRTYTAQMEALRKYRHGGEQKVTVEHVTVNEGGQAIVGNVERGEGRNEKRR